MANMVLFPESLLWIWTGKMDLAEKASVFLPIIAVSISMLSIAIIPYNIAIANGYTKLNNLIGLISILVTIPGYWIATKQMGAKGAALVFCVVQTLTTLIYTYFINAKFLRTKKITSIYFKEILMPMALALLVTTCFTFVPHWIATNRITMLLWIGCSTGVTFITLFLILLKKEDRKPLVQLLKHPR
jgi:O-antigen/teichoic acid export membrane protein